MAIKKTTVAPSAASGSIATKPAKQRLNTDKREMDMSNPYRQGGGNTPLKIASCGGTPEAIHYDDILESTGTKVSYPADFQTTIDKSDRIPAWKPMTVGIDSPDAITRTNEPIYHQGFRKSPKVEAIYGEHVTEHGISDNDIIRHAHKQDGGTIIHQENSQVDKPFSPTSTAIYGGKLPKRSSTSLVS